MKVQTEHLNRALQITNIDISLTRARLIEFATDLRLITEEAARPSLSDSVSFYAHRLLALKAIRKLIKNALLVRHTPDILFEKLVRIDCALRDVSENTRKLYSVAENHHDEPTRRYYRGVANGASNTIQQIKEAANGPYQEEPF